MSDAVEEIQRLEEAVADAERRAARAEQERDEAKRHIKQLREVIRYARSESGSRSSQAERRVALLTEALATAAVPLEVLAGQIWRKPYKELTKDLQDEIVRATLAVREALVARAALAATGAAEREASGGGTAARSKDKA